MDAKDLSSLSQRSKKNCVSYDHVVNYILEMAKIRALEGKYCFELDYTNDKYKILKNTSAQIEIIKHLKALGLQVKMHYTSFAKGSYKLIISWRDNEDQEDLLNEYLKIQKMLIDLQESVQNERIV